MQFWFWYIIKKNCNIEVNEVDLKLNEYYPNAKIIKIKKFNKHSIDELKDFFKNNINTYAYFNNLYYYSEGDEYKSFDEEQAFQKILKNIKN